jgi:ribonuclease Y
VEGNLLPILLSLVGGLTAGITAGYLYRRNIAEGKIGRAEDEAKQIINDALKKAEATKRETILEAKEEIHKLRNEFERESRERRNEIQRAERRLMQREENLDRKLDNLESREEMLNRRQKDIQKMQDEVNFLHQKQLDELERISNMTMDEAREILLANVEKEAKHDAAVMVREIENKAKDEAERKARNIISLAIQKCAADHVAEATVSVVPLPNDEMKGRIIGREGRNIRTLETATGIDLIIDDTPEAVILSGFDPIRREVARIALEKLILDGRIHPARIEEMVEKAKKEVDNQIREAGEQAIFEVGIQGLHPELVKLLGTKYEFNSYPDEYGGGYVECFYGEGLGEGLPVYCFQGCK